MKYPNELTQIARRLTSKPIFRGSLFLIIGLLVAAQFLQSSSANFIGKNARTARPVSAMPAIAPSSELSRQLVNLVSYNKSNNNVSFGLLPLAMPGLPLAGPESVATYAAGCTTPMQNFNVTAGSVTVCAKASDLDDDFGKRSIYWVNPSGDVVQVDTVTEASPSASRVISTLGNWRAYLVDGSDGSVRDIYRFTVSDAGEPRYDLSVFKGSRSGEVGSGGLITYQIIVTNNGPDTASGVELTDAVPTGTTYNDSSQDSGPTFTRTQETPSTTWGIASLAPGASATFTFIYDVTASAGETISNTVSVTAANSGTDELNSDDNTWTAVDLVGSSGGGATCSLDCPNSVVVTATTHGVGGGAVVNFAAPEAVGDCGTVNLTQASGTFFPIGTTTVQATGDGGGFCSFTVTVIDSAAPTISCPSNLSASTVSGSGDTEAFVPGPGGPSAVGSPTATGNNVIVTGGRSDGQGLTDAYPIGVTTITWTATECNNPPDCDDGFARSASCTQTVTVTSADFPTITCPSNKTFDAAGNCQKTLTSGDIGTPTTGGLSPTVTSSRSDGLPLTDPYPIGQTTITWTATNALGTVSCIQVITITSSGDTAPPVLTVPANVSVTTDTCSALVDDELGVATATDTCSSQVNITRTGVPRVACPIPGDPGRTCESFVFPVGTTEVTYTATDGAGNTAIGVQLVTVTDSTPPTFVIVPSNVGPVNNDPGLCGAYISDATLGTATVSDNCDTGVIRSGVPAGNIFPVGVTTVTYRAKADLSVSVTQTVTVVDNTAPVITVNGSMPSMWPPNHKYQTFQLTSFVTGASDNCGVVSLSSVVIEKVTSDETENGNGDGNTTNDIIIAANCKSVQLRAERDGGGDGRVYTITFKVTDSHGNVTRATSKVVVPHNNGQTAVDSGVHYTVTSACY